MEDSAAPADFFEEARGISGESADCSPSAPSFPGNIFGKTNPPKALNHQGILRNYNPLTNTFLERV
ncbi:hypothetical protein Q8A64_19015, partial [Oxalobacteraceae bacterium R-40]|nr:hypothetical protein [Oxalobacteraceae bacterium R-40]